MSDDQINSGYDFIKSIQNKMVEVHLTDDSIAKGKFVCIDGNMNIVLEGCTHQT